MSTITVISHDHKKELPEVPEGVILTSFSEEEGEKIVRSIEELPEDSWEADVWTPSKGEESDEEKEEKKEPRPRYHFLHLEDKDHSIFELLATQLTDVEIEKVKVEKYGEIQGGGFVAPEADFMFFLGGDSNLLLKSIESFSIPESKALFRENRTEILIPDNSFLKLETVFQDTHRCRFPARKYTYYPPDEKKELKDEVKDHSSRVLRKHPIYRLLVTVK
jgi:hypothetical protein